MSIRWPKSLWAAPLCLVAVGPSTISAEKLPDNASFTKPASPRFQLFLTANEFTVFHAAATAGVAQYGGDASFQVRIAKQGDVPIWTVTLSDSRLMEVWTHWMAERTTELFVGLNLNHLDENTKAICGTYQSIVQKLKQARANPVWDSVTLVGTVTKTKIAYYIDVDSSRIKITGRIPDEFALLQGKAIVATGFVKVAGELELLRFVERRKGVLELFVMSHCPFAQQIEGAIVESLRSLSTSSIEQIPQIEVHYIFYVSQENNKLTYSAMHGEEEVGENLFQMILQGLRPELFNEYLHQRARSKAPFRDLARSVGLTPEEIDFITWRMETERDSLIAREYNYVTQKYGIYDKSPTIAWEGEIVDDIRKLSAFRKLGLSTQEKCQQ